MLARFPELRRFDRIAAQTRARLLEPYNTYVTEVSNDAMAISFQLASFLGVLCEIAKPARILDLGSGFSSFVFRRYGLQFQPQAVVVSVDDSSEWLEQTRRFLENHSLPTDDLMSWDSFMRQRLDPFDLVLHDLGDMDKRIAALEPAVAAAGPRGMVVLDDIHKQVYGAVVYDFLRRRGVESYSLKAYTQDRLGRYSLLVTL